MPEALELSPAEVRTRTDMLLSLCRPLTHRLCNDLAYLSGTYELVLTQVTDEATVTLVTTAATYATEVCEDFRGLLRALVPSPSRVPRTIGVRRLLDRARSGIGPLAVTLVGDQRAQVRVVPGEFVPALAGLLRNSAEAGADAVCMQVEPEGSVLALRLYDNGRGFASGQLQHALTPFVTTKSPPHRGIGLSAVIAALAHHAGSFRVENLSGGAQVTLRIPATTQHATLAADTA